MDMWTSIMTETERFNMCRLSEWLKENFNRIQFFDSVEIKNGVTVKNTINRNLTLGLLSTNNKDEFRDLAFHYAPVGCIRDDIDETYYNDKILLLSNELTKLLFDEQNRAIAEKYLKILEKRDKDHWLTDKPTTSVQATTKDTTLNITFT